MRMRRYAPILILALAGCGPCGYNGIVNEEQQVEAAWSQVENQLQRRADLIPNRVETVKGYARHEKGVFDDIANARAAMLGASSRAEKIQTANQFEGAISKIMADPDAELHSHGEHNCRLLLEKKNRRHHHLAENNDMLLLPRPPQ